MELTLNVCVLPPGDVQYFTLYTMFNLPHALWRQLLEALVLDTGWLNDLIHCVKLVSIKILVCLSLHPVLEHCANQEPQAEDSETSVSSK